jgi:hypothetical protein
LLWSCKPKVAHIHFPLFSKGAPTIVPSPGTVNAQIERTATLLCRTAGIPKPKVQWLKNAKAIGENGAGRYTKLPDDSLLIKGKCAKEIIRNCQK